MNMKNNIDQVIGQYFSAMAYIWITIYVFPIQQTCVPFPVMNTVPQGIGATLAK